MRLPAHAGTWRCALSGALGGGKLCASEIATPCVLSQGTSTVGNLSGQCVACGASRKTRPSAGPMRAVALCDARMRCDLELCSKELPPWVLYPGSSTSVSALVAGSVMWPGWRDLRLHPRVRRSLPIGLTFTSGMCRALTGVPTHSAAFSLFQCYLSWLSQLNL